MGALKMYYDKDADFKYLKGKTIAIVGYGSQGHAQAQNLRDSGLSVIVGELEGTANYELAVEHGFKPVSAEEAAQKADIIQLLVPDHVQKIVYEKAVAKHMKAGKALVFSHGFNIHYGCIQPPPEVDVYMVAPKGPGHLVRSVFVEGGGVPCLIALPQDASGQARQLRGERTQPPRRDRNRSFRRTHNSLRRPLRPDESRVRDPCGSRIRSRDGLLRMRA